MHDDPPSLHDVYVADVFGVDPSEYGSSETGVDDDGAPSGDLTAHAAPNVGSAGQGDSSAISTLDSSNREADTSNAGSTDTLQDQPTANGGAATAQQTLADGAGTSGNGSGNFALASPLGTPADAQSGTPHVTKVTLLQTGGGITGFGSNVNNRLDLNVLGTHNNAATGECYLVFHIKFDFVGFQKGDIVFVRHKDGIAGSVGHESKRSGLDGPSRPGLVDGDTFSAVADGPGLAGGPKEAFPINYNVNFTLDAFNGSRKLASATYNVSIQKKTFDDASPACSISGFNSTLFP